MKELFQKYAASKSEGTRIYNVLCRTLYGDAIEVIDLDGALKANLPMFTFEHIMKDVKGIGRKAMHVIVDVVSDILGE